MIMLPYKIWTCKAIFEAGKCYRLATHPPYLPDLAPFVLYNLKRSCLFIVTSPDKKFTQSSVCTSEMYINRPILMNFKNGLRVWKYLFNIADVTLISFLVSMLFRYHTIIHRNIKVVCSSIWIKFWKKKFNLIRAETKTRNVDPPQ